MSLLFWSTIVTIKLLYRPSEIRTHFSIVFVYVRFPPNVPPLEPPIAKLSIISDWLLHPLETSEHLTNKLFTVEPCGIRLLKTL